MIESAKTARPRALICGISGQDGAYLANLLLDKGYEVAGTARDHQVSRFNGLERLGIRRRIQLTSMAINDFRSVLQAIARFEPTEIYNLAGQSSVGLSFEQPVETLESISVGTLNILEGIRFLNPAIRLYNAGSGECFGDTDGLPAREDTPFRPRSPYAVAKAAAFWQVANYREAYGLFACSGILFNHESPLRPERFVTQKIARAAARIAQGAPERLVLGNLDVERDWGWAPEYVDAMWRMMQCEAPADFVIGTGTSNPLRLFVEECFSAVGLDWRDHVESSDAFMRPTDIRVSRADVAKAGAELGWRAASTMQQVAQRMVAAQRESPGRPVDTPTDPISGDVPHGH